MLDFTGADERSRTADLLITKLYRIVPTNSYKNPQVLDFQGFTIYTVPISSY